MYVYVVSYQPQWPRLFDQEAEGIRKILKDNLIAIHHIGSTAVPGLMAKPVIDIMPVVRSLAQVDACTGGFRALGYEALGEWGIKGRRYFRKGGDQRTHQIHVFAGEDVQNIRRHLAVRDYLRAHPEEAAAYGALKAELARVYPQDIEGYCDGKDAFVKALERKALAWMTEKSGSD